MAILLLQALFPAAAQEPVDLTKRALAGDAGAQQTLGDRYRLGIGVQQDGAQALRFYKLAAEQGVAEAQFALAEIYRYGEAGEAEPKPRAGIAARQRRDCPRRSSAWE